VTANPGDPPDLEPVPAPGAGALDDQITRFLGGVRFVERRLGNAAGIAAAAGAVDTVLAFVIDWRIGVAVAVLVVLTVAALLVYRRRLTRLTASEAEIRADLRSGSLTPEVRQRVQDAVRRFESGGVQSRLGAARGIGDALRDHPVATRAASIRQTFVGPTLQFTAWALGLTGLFLVALVPLAVVAIVVTVA